MTTSLLDRRVYWTRQSRRMADNTRAETVDIPMSGHLRALHCDTDGWWALVEDDEGKLWSIDATTASTRGPSTEAK